MGWNDYNNSMYHDVYMVYNKKFLMGRITYDYYWYLYMFLDEV